MRLDVHDVRRGDHASPAPFAPREVELGPARSRRPRPARSAPRTSRSDRAQRAPAKLDPTTGPRGVLVGCTDPGDVELNLGTAGGHVRHRRRDALRSGRRGVARPRPAAAVPDRVRLIIGHNPGIGDLAVMLAGHGDTSLASIAAKFPTAAFANLTIDQPWSAVEPGAATSRSTGHRADFRCRPLSAPMHQSLIPSCRGPRHDEVALGLMPSATTRSSSTMSATPRRSGSWACSRCGVAVQT